MKPRKNTVLIFVLALLLSAFSAVAAQTPAQGDQKKSEACCSTQSCCCCSDSCDMKKHDAKNHSEKGECCKMKDKDKAKTKQKAA